MVARHPRPLRKPRSRSAAGKAGSTKIGDTIIDPGNPVGLSKTVSAAGVSDDGGPNPLSGYTIIQADSIDRAVELAKACPIIGDGSIEVAEIHEVTM